MFTCILTDLIKIHDSIGGVHRPGAIIHHKSNILSYGMGHTTHRHYYILSFSTCTDQVMHPSSITGNIMGAKLEGCTSYFFLSNNFSKRVKYCVMETECNPDEECEIYQAYYDPRMFGGFGGGLPPSMLYQGYAQSGSSDSGMKDNSDPTNAPNTENPTQMEKKVNDQLIIGLVVGAVLFLLLVIVVVFQKRIKLRIMGK